MNTKKTDRNDHGIQTRLRDAHRENLVEKPDIKADEIEDKEANVQNNSEVIIRKTKTENERKLLRQSKTENVRRKLNPTPSKSTESTG